MYITNAHATRNTGTARTAMRTAAVVIGLFIGTGSNAAPIGVERITSYSKYKSEKQETLVAKKFSSDGVDVRSPLQHLENIKQSLSLPVSETALVFGVTRQSIYKWMAGTTPDHDKVDKIVELSRIADIFKAESVPRPADLLRMKAFEGRSVLDMVKNGEDHSQHLAVLVAESKAMDEAYTASGIANLPQRRTEDWKATVSIPFSDEA
jgi:predicted transcriptional regulator